MADWLTIQDSQPMSPEEVMELALKQYPCIRSFACFSSGNDSQVSTHFSMTNGYAQEVFNINTGIGIPEAREHLYRTCDRFSWPLRVKTPPELTYEQMVLKFGFPGPGAHTYPYVWLKERAINELVQETKRHHSDQVMLITGVRETESARRMGFVEPIHKQGAQIWVAPFYGATTRERDAYMEMHRLVRNPVTEKLFISGECLCGAYASKGERSRIKKFYPEFDSYLSWLEGHAEESGQSFCRWGNGVRIDPNQTKLDFMPMCNNCLLAENRERWQRGERIEKFL